MKFTVLQTKQFLTDHYQGVVSDVIALSGGNWSQAFAFNRQSQARVVRFGRHVEDYRKDQLAPSFVSKGLPIPKVLEIGEAFGAHFAVSERAFGTMLDELDQPSMKKIVPAVLEMLDAMRQIDLSAFKGFGRWDATGKAPHKTWQDYLLHVGIDDPAQRTHGWRTKLATSSIGDSAFNKWLKRLEQMVQACPNDKHLIHTDLLNQNALVDDNHISAVIDWGNAICGDFLHELACFSYWSKWFPSMQGIDWEAEAKRHFKEVGLSAPNFDERMLCYKLHISLEHQAYNAFTENWDELATNTRYALELVKN